MRKFGKSDEAFTGLEAAIVLIAFVVVAAVFSYVMLGAGFFTSQKSQEVVHTSVQQASASCEIKGEVFGLDKTATTGDIHTIQFTVAPTSGGTAIDFDKVVMTFSTASDVDTVDHVASVGSLVAGTWTIAEKLPAGKADTDDLLEDGEQFVIKLMPATALGVNTRFTIDMKPGEGSALGISRKTPAQIDPVNYLY